jgi:hypothetical protein
MDLISVNKNPTTVMLTWDATTNVHCATCKVVCKRSCHVACQAATELERGLRFSSVTNRVATLNVPVPSYFSARFLGQLFENVPISCGVVAGLVLTISGIFQIKSLGHCVLQTLLTAQKAVKKSENITKKASH